MEKTMTLGITGGIGSGKSYVSRIFARMGYPVYYSDDRAKRLYDTDPLLLQQMVQLLGEDIIVGGRLNRKIVAGKIFGNRELLEEVEKLVHPAVMRDFCKWKGEVCTAMAVNGKLPSFVLFESAILLEKPAVRGCVDKVLTIAAPYELRIERVMARDAVTKGEVEARIATQWSDKQREALSDFIIFADSRRALLPQIMDVIEKMKR